MLKMFLEKNICRNFLFQFFLQNLIFFIQDVIQHVIQHVIQDVIQHVIQDIIQHVIQDVIQHVIQHVIQDVIQHVIQHVIQDVIQHVIQEDIPHVSAGCGCGGPVQLLRTAQEGGEAAHASRQQEARLRLGVRSFFVEIILFIILYHFSTFSQLQTFDSSYRDSSVQSEASKKSLKLNDFEILIQDQVLKTRQFQCILQKF